MRRIKKTHGIFSGIFNQEESTIISPIYNEPKIKTEFVTNGLLNKAFTFTRATVASAFTPAGVYTTVASGVPRENLSLSQDGSNPGLIIEGARTNSLRNSNMSSAVVGTPGTLPTTSVSIINNPNLTADVVASGVTANSIPYMDLRVHGTTTSGSFQLAFENSMQIAALTAQVWTGSVYLAIISGTFTNISTAKFVIQELTSLGAFITSAASADFTGTLTSSLQRLVLTDTLSGGATTAFTRSLISLNCNNTAAVDITLRIAMPQLELGGFVSSYIPTSTVAATRNTELAILTGITSLSWFSLLSGTIFASWMRGVGTNVISCPISFNNNATGERIDIQQSAAGTSVSCIDVTGSSQVVTITKSSLTANAAAKTAFEYKANDYAASTNGAAVGTASSGAIAAVTQVQIGQNTGNAIPLWGSIFNAYYINDRVNNNNLIIRST